MTIDLYHMDASGPCRSVRMTAKMLGVELNVKLINLQAGEHMTPEFIKINPHQLIRPGTGFTLFMDELKIPLAKWHERRTR